ncbi:hypothetical protein RSAG8_05971, partial [Rhizoctonia solani AG-8 WAC10335]
MRRIELRRVFIIHPGQSTRIGLHQLKRNDIAHRTGIGKWVILKFPSSSTRYKTATLALANWDEDDRTGSLADSLGMVTVEDPNESEGGVKHEPVDDESVPLIESSIDQKGDNEDKSDKGPNSEYSQTP